MKCCVVGAGNSNGKVGASRTMGDAGTDGSAVLIENQRRIVGARSSGRRVGRQHLCCGSRSSGPGYASCAGRSSGPARPRRSGGGDVKRKSPHFNSILLLHFSIKCIKIKTKIIFCFYFARGDVMPRVAYSEKDKERIRTALITVGLELMAKQGIQHTTVEQVYKKVGFSQQKKIWCLKHYIGSSLELLSMFKN